MWLVFLMLIGFFLIINALKSVKKLVKGEKLDKDDIGSLGGLVGGVIGGILMYNYLS